MLIVDFGPKRDRERSGPNEIGSNVDMWSAVETA